MEEKRTERERELACSGLEEKKRMKGVNGRRFKDTNYPRKLKLSNAGDYILGRGSHDLTSYKAVPLITLSAPTRSTRSSFLRGNKNKSLPRPLVKPRV